MKTGTLKLMRTGMPENEEMQMREEGSYYEPLFSDL